MLSFVMNFLGLSIESSSYVKHYNFVLPGVLLGLMSERIGALSIKTLRPSPDRASYFHAGPINHDVATPAIKPPSWKFKYQSSKSHFKLNKTINWS